jgi:phosphoenolpyruvate synthase/pyruvate phosphate dikinase
LAKVRTFFAREVDALLPVLHETYRLIGSYQKRRGSAQEKRLLTQLEIVGEQLRFFKPYLQPRKQAYFDALMAPQLSTSDRIIALDTAVGMMHIEFAVERAYVHQESKALRRVLEASRLQASDTVADSNTDDDRILIRGIAASPGIATGKAALVRRNADYRRVPADCIVVAPMTRPEIIMGTERVAGIVTDQGGSLCHAAIVARERGIPCIVGTGDATSTIRPRSLVIVDGSLGEVRRARRSILPT